MTGSLVQHERLPDELWPQHTSLAYRMLYESLGYHGGPRVVSGMVLMPDTPVPTEGLPIVAYAHGTTGLGDNAAPSRMGLTRLERAHVARWLASGYLVAVTDYEGLATPGPHPYLNGEAVADDIVDAVRAARQLGVPTSGSWVAVGFSQGAHAALFVGLMASRYAPELDFRGTVALAPPVHLPLLVRTLTADGSRLVSILTSYLLAGLPTSHPEFDPSGLLTDQGRRLVQLAATAPLLELLRASRGLTNDNVGTTALHDRAGIARLLDSCRVPTARFDRPVFLAAGGADDVVPLQVVELFADDLRSAGSEIEFMRHEHANHADVLVAEQDAIISWATRLLIAPARSPSPTADGARSQFSLLDATGDGYVSRDDYRRSRWGWCRRSGSHPDRPPRWPYGRDTANCGARSPAAPIPASTPGSASPNSSRGSTPSAPRSASRMTSPRWPGRSSRSPTATTTAC